MKSLKFKNAAELAELLEAASIKTGKVTEPNKKVDGMIVITEQVHVQVPLHGYEPNVVRETGDGKLDFGDQRNTMQLLVDDINTALSGEPLTSDDD